MPSGISSRCASPTSGAPARRWPTASGGDNHALVASIQSFIYNFVRKHETTKEAPAVTLGVTDHRWSLEEVVAMTDAYLVAHEEAAFEAAFATKFSEKPTARTTCTPTPKDKLQVPWYLDPESGGPNPLVKKPGIAYDETQPLEDYNS